MNPHKHHFGHWMRHMASVPKGYLKHSVLRLLSEKSLSGSEIMSRLPGTCRSSILMRRQVILYPLLPSQDPGNTMICGNQ